MASELNASNLETKMSSLTVTDDGSSSSSSYQVIILAGFGHNLYPLTEEDNLPKALLPIANRPLLYFPLEWCSKAGFLDVTVVCHSESRKQISAYTSSLSLGLDIKVEAASSVEDNMGSADVLGLLSENIKTDFIVLSCDTFTTLPPADLISFHATQNSSATAVFFDSSKNEDLVNLKLKENDTSLYVGFERQSNRLLFLKSAIDVHESLDLRTSLLWRFPRMNLMTTLQDAHIYIFKRWVIEFVKRNEKISSLRTDLLPVLAKMQWQSNLRKREEINDRMSLENIVNIVLPIAEPHATSQNALSDTLPLPSNLQTSSPLSVSLYITSPSQYTLRTNSLPTYLLLNYHHALLDPGPPKHPSSRAGAKTSVGQDSLVAENCTLGERVQIRKSVLATGITVGSKTVIRGSVVMEGTTIGENVKLEGCVICKGAKISDKVSLTECFVGAGYVVSEGTKMSKQNLVELDELEDGTEDDEDDE